jgi:predicted dithiol-disulfide oxidoreductase (DUF899 family)
MATNFKYTKGESKQEMDKHFVVKKEWQKEREHVMALEKELKKHEKTDMSHAHPRHSPSSKMSQPSAGIPALRKG